MREMAAKDEDVVFYHQHKDDDDTWGKASQRDQPRRRETLTATITVRFSAEEAGAIRRLSQAKRMSYSDVIREAVRRYTQPAFSVEVGVITASFFKQSWRQRCGAFTQACDTDDVARVGLGPRW
jgi:hypothetical protein